MAQCKDCIHNGVCKIYSGFIKNHDCELFVGKADVVPKSEVEQLKAELDKQKLWERLLKAESHAPIIKKAKQEVAREIFEEIDELLVQNATMQIATSTLHCKLAELKKKYTEVENNE